MSRLIIAVDPGSRGTGIVLRFGDDLPGHALVERVGPDPLPDVAYLHEVNAAVCDRPDLKERP